MDIIERLKQDISRNAYHAKIQEKLNEICYDADMMSYHLLTARGKAFEAIALLNLLTDSTDGDSVYEEAERDAAGVIKGIQPVSGEWTMQAIIFLLDEAGFYGEEYFRSHL